MKEIIALLIFLVISGLTITLAIRRRIGNSLTVILLLFAIISGWGIVKYDAQQQVPGFSAVRENTIDDIRQEGENQRRSLTLLGSGATEIHEKIISQKKDIESLLDSVNKVREDFNAQEHRVQELNANVEKTKAEIETTYRAFSDLALLLTKVAWLQFQATGESRDGRAQAAVQQIMDVLDEIVALVIPDQQARTEFVSKVMTSLPPQQ